MQKNFVKSAGFHYVKSKKQCRLISSHEAVGDAVEQTDTLYLHKFSSSCSFGNNRLTIPFWLHIQNGCPWNSMIHNLPKVACGGI